MSIDAPQMTSSGRFSVEGYRSLLRENGFTLIEVHADPSENTYYLARKSA